MLSLFSRTELFAERVTGSAALVVQAEVDVLQENARFFGKHDPTANPDKIDFSEAVEEIITIASKHRWNYRPNKKEPSSSPWR
jgi:hypothetical protein